MEEDGYILEPLGTLANYMGDNRLVINDDKTHLLVMGSAKFSEKRKMVRIDTGNVIVKPRETEKLLGLNIHQSLKWKEHLLTSDKSLLKILVTRLAALKKVAVSAPFKTRLMVANACFLSVISYMITVWGGTELYLIRAIQVMQNKAARCVTKRSWFSPTRLLLLEYNWLSIKQLVFYHTVLQVWKVRVYKTPGYIASRIRPAITRSVADGNLRVPNVQKSISGKSFMVRSAVMWNSVPAEIRNTISFESFKRKLKQWTRTNVDIE